MHSVLERATQVLVKEEGCPLHPYWPGGKHSGVSWGIGWDAGHHSAQQILDDWAELPAGDLAKLKTVAGKKGADAKTALSDVKKIVIPKDVAMKVFKNTTLPDYYEKTLAAFPGCNLLPVPVQVALISLVYNRGASMKDKKGTNDRLEMRMIQMAVRDRDLQWIADELRSMKRVWKGQDIEKLMNHRREAEARLVDEALLSLPEWSSGPGDSASLIQTTIP